MRNSTPSPQDDERTVGVDSMNMRLKDVKVSREEMLQLRGIAGGNVCLDAGSSGLSWVGSIVVDEG